MNTLFELLQKRLTGKLILVLFAITMAVYLVMLLYTIPAVTAFAPETPIFDLSPSGYSVEYAAQLLEALGIEGRNTYLKLQLPVDFIYPGLFAISYSLMLIWLLGQSTQAGSKLNWLAIVPILAGVFDYSENVLIIKMLTSFPTLPAGTVNLASLFTQLKSGFTLVFFVVLTLALALWAKQRLSRARA